MNILSDLIPARARQAIYAVVGLLSILAAIPDLLPAAWGAKTVAVLAALSSALAVGNVAPKDAPGGDPAKDAGNAQVGLLLRVVAAVCLAVFTLASHGTITTAEGFTWLGAGLLFWLLASFA